MAAAVTATSRPNYILTGIDNWKHWFSDFKADARANDTWSLFDGTEAVHEKPGEDAFMTTSLVEAPTNTAPSLPYISVIKQPGPEVTHHDLAWTRELKVFRMQQHRYEQQNERVRRANKMLYDRIHASTRAEIEDVLDPAEAFRHLELRFKTPEHLTRQMAFKRIHNLTLGACENMTAYLNEIRRGAQALRARDD